MQFTTTDNINSSITNSIGNGSLFERSDYDISNPSSDLPSILSHFSMDKNEINDRSRFLLCNDSLDKQIIECLYNLGMSPALKGFRYLKLAIKMGLIDIQNIDLITKFTYPKIARVYGTNSKAVERSIRTCIRTLGDDVKGYSNKKFIFMIIYRLNLEGLE